ncbi:MAG: hypothetical protein J6C53_02310 [Clostridia bacterium]|nr:hypothetical protein [Clostridia bacterium]
MRTYLSTMGFGNGEIDQILAVTHVKNPDIVKRKLNFYKTNLGFTDDDIKRIVKLIPPFLGYDTEGNSSTSINKKIDFYKLNFGLTDEEVSKLVKLSPALLGLDTNSVSEKLCYLQEYFDFSNAEIRELIKNCPAILGYDIKWKVCEKVSFYAKYFGITEEGAKKIIKSRPNLLGRDTKGVEKRVELLMDLIGCDEKRAKGIIVSLPTILTYDIDSMKGKVKYYEKALSIAPAEVGKMFGKCPSIICYSVEEGDEKSTPSKLKYLRQIATDEEIVQNPALLTHPALKVKARYLILSQAFYRGEIVGNRKMTTSEDKLWARYRFCQDNDKNPRLMIRSEERFKQGSGGVGSSALVKKYPLTQEDIHKLEKTHEEKTGERVYLDEIELQSLFGDEGIENA